MKASIEQYFRLRVEQAHALANGKESPASVGQMAQVGEALARRYGKPGFRLIHQRSIGLVGQVVGGEPPPPVAHLSVDGIQAVEVDIAAEAIAEESRRAGVRPTRDPGWRETVNRGWHRMIDDWEKRMLARIPKPEAVPQQTLESRVAEEVTRQLAERATKDGTTDRSESRFWSGVWEAGATYFCDTSVTHAGTLWHCESDRTTDRPGTSPAWKLMVKAHPRHDKHGATP